jgi:hypothetical protein
LYSLPPGNSSGHKKYQQRVARQEELTEGVSIVNINKLKVILAVLKIF